MRLWRKLTWEELKLFVREPLTVVFAIGFPLVMLFVLAEVFGTAPAETDPGDPVAFRGVSPLSYYVPAYVALAAAAVGLVMVPGAPRGVPRARGAAALPRRLDPRVDRVRRPDRRAVRAGRGRRAARRRGRLPRLRLPGARGSSSARSSPSS